MLLSYQSHFHILPSEAYWAAHTLACRLGFSPSSPAFLMHITGVANQEAVHTLSFLLHIFFHVLIYILLASPSSIPYPPATCATSGLSASSHIRDTNAFRPKLGVSPRVAINRAGFTTQEWIYKRNICGMIANLLGTAGKRARVMLVESRAGHVDCCRFRCCC